MAIHRFKYHRERARAAHLGATLVPLLAQLPRRVASAPLQLVPVPLSATRLRERGYNQAELLARIVATARGDQINTALERTRKTVPQVGLDREARRQNVQGAFRWNAGNLTAQPVLLIDDVLTTGATANECAATLKAVGASWVGIITIARAVGHSATTEPDSGLEQP